MSGLYDNDIEKMRKINFLLPNEGEKDFRQDLHYTKLWADVFWRRRERHKSRVDPEIQHLPNLNPMKVLEIGCAYGRVTNKIINSLDIEVIVEGIEVSKHFETYFNIYKNENPLLEKVKIYYDNFFKTNLLLESSYDLIILPMNTLPGFPYQAIEPFFNKIKSCLTNDGVFLFSTYKLSKGITEELLSNIRQNNYQSEVLSDPTQDIIISEFFSPETIVTDYGAKSYEYISNNRLDREYKLIERGIFFSQTEFILPTHLEQIASKSGFEIVIKDDSSHSLVYGFKVSK